MSAATPQGPERKLTLEEAAEKVAGEFSNVFADSTERNLFKEDYKLLVRTYVMERSGIVSITAVVVPAPTLTRLY